METSKTCAIDCFRDDKFFCSAQIFISEIIFWLTHRDTFILVMLVIPRHSSSAVFSSFTRISTFFMGSVHQPHNPEYQTFFQINVFALCVRYYMTTYQTFFQMRLQSFQNIKPFFSRCATTYNQSRISNLFPDKCVRTLCALLHDNQTEYSMNVEENVGT